MGRCRSISKLAAALFVPGTGAIVARPAVLRVLSQRRSVAGETPRISSTSR
jgi:hypothetical protein